MGIGAYVIRKYYEYFYNEASRIGDLERQPMNPMEQLYTHVGDKICFGCKEYQLCKPQTGIKEEEADLLYCKKCEIFYTGKQYIILSKNFQE